MSGSKKLITLAIIVVTLVSLPLGEAAEPEHGKRPKSVILFIGDGMGLAQTRAAALYARQAIGRETTLSQIPINGVTATQSANSDVTDSSAAASAIYSGHKVNNGAMNILPDGRKAFTIAQAAKKAGKSVGVVSTTRLTHATPGAIYAHSADRDDENYIAEQLPEFEPEVALGGGTRHFIPQGSAGSKRTDDKDLIAVMKNKGYAYVTTVSELGKINPASCEKLLGLFAQSNMDFDIDRENDPVLASQPTMTDMTKAALAILAKNPDGFFLMVEGGRIDHACHGHDIKAAIQETLAMDDAVNAALKFQKDRPEILIIVTADHETGGLGLGRGTQYSIALARLKPIRRSLDYLSQLIMKDPVKREQLVEAAGFGLDKDEKELLLQHPSDAKVDLVPELQAIPRLSRYVSSWDHKALSEIEARRAGIGWTSYVHTAQPVITYAVGPGEEEFLGSYDNTDIPKKVSKLLGLTLE
jgi:alkaline phosphatase